MKVKYTGSVKSVNVKTRFLTGLFIVAISTLISIMAWNLASAYEDPDYYNSQDNINWEELYGKFNYDYGQNIEIPNNSLPSYSYTYTLNVDDSNAGNIYEFFGGDNPLELPYTGVLSCDNPSSSPWFRLVDQSIIFYSANGETYLVPDFIYYAEGKEGYAFKGWTVTDTAGNVIKPDEAITGNFICTAEFYEKSTITGAVVDENGTIFLGANISYTEDETEKVFSTQADAIGEFALDVPLGSTGTLKISYDNGIAQPYLPVYIDIEDKLEAEGLNVGTVMLYIAARISGSVIGPESTNVDATVSFYDNETGEIYWTTTTTIFGRTSFSLPVPIGSTGILYVESDDYVRAKRLINEPVPSTGLYSVDFILNEGVTLTFNQGKHCTIYYNDEVVDEAHVPTGAELEMYYDGYYGYINIWDPQAHGPGDYPYDIIACEPEEGYEFDTFTFNPEPAAGILNLDTTISASVRTRTDYNPFLFGFIRDSYGYTVQKAYITFYDEYSGTNTTVTTNSYGYYKLTLTPEAKGLVVVSAPDCSTQIQDITIPKDELYNQIDFNLLPGNDFIMIGETGHASFSANFYINDEQYGPTVTLGNPEHLGVSDGGKITVNADNSLTYVYDLIPGEKVSATITPMSQTAFDFAGWVYREDVKQLMPGSTVSIYDDITLSASYQFNIERATEMLAEYNGLHSGVSPQTGDFSGPIALLVTIIAAASTLFIYWRKPN